MSNEVFTLQIIW